MGGISSQYSCSTCSSFPSTAAVNQSRIKVRQDSPCQDLSYFSCPGATAASTAVPTSADYCTLLWQYYTIQFIQPPTSLSFPEEIWTPAALLEVLALIWAGIPAAGVDWSTGAAGENYGNTPVFGIEISRWGISSRHWPVASGQARFGRAREIRPIWWIPLTGWIKAGHLNKDS